MISDPLCKLEDTVLEKDTLLASIDVEALYRSIPRLWAKGSDIFFAYKLWGTTIGSPCAPTYTNLLLGWWEDSVGL